MTVDYFFAQGNFSVFHSKCKSGACSTIMQWNSKRTPEFLSVEHTKSCFPMDSTVEILTWEPMERLDNDSDLSIYSCPRGVFRNSKIYKSLLFAHISIVKSQIGRKSGGNIFDRFRARRTSYLWREEANFYVGLTSTNNALTFTRTSFCAIFTWSY